MAPVAETNSKAFSDLNLKDNLTLMATHEKKLELVTSKAPLPGPGQALVHVKATGVCGSDVHFWQHAGLGPWKIEDRVAVGHESGGVVLAVGEGVTNVKPGDRVAIEPGVPCFKATCDYCRKGSYNLCPEVDFYSVPPKDGTLTRYHVHPAGWLHKVPDSMSYEEIALLEPLSVTLQATILANIQLGNPVLITGAGPIGAVQLLCASAAGAFPIVITDLSQERLDFAKRLVPNVETYKIDTKKTPEEAAVEIRNAFTRACGHEPGTGNDCAPQISMECTGVESSIATASFATAPQGLVFVIGVGRDYQTIPFMHLSTNEISLKFLFRYRDTWPRAIRLVTGGKINVKQIVTSRFPLEKAKEAVEHAADRSKFSVKTIILDED
ncbi:putative xylitol dehydrogenase [Violaceomyces palustris]|uniref:Xylitol dehydrogenase n=1 Tax=Violaceomyces palustris TaxID=1673888 RepID=A0ACD0P7I7_9BASI|nr:putative xylitol dehydrogenase [Violaceomyces palustris]